MYLFTVYVGSYILHNGELSDQVSKDIYLNQDECGSGKKLQAKVCW